MPGSVKKVRVVAKSTGREQVVPAHWLDNPVIAAGFEKPGRSRGAVSAGADGSSGATSTKKEK